MFSLDTIEHLANMYDVADLTRLRLESNFPQDGHYGNTSLASKTAHLLQTKLLAHYMTIIGK